jgi:hypothetical protein
MTCVSRIGDLEYVRPQQVPHPPPARGTTFHSDDCPEGHRRHGNVCGQRADGSLALVGESPLNTPASSQRWWRADGWCALRSRTWQLRYFESSRAGCGPVRLPLSLRACQSRTGHGPYVELRARPLATTDRVRGLVSLMTLLFGPGEPSSTVLSGRASAVAAWPW